MCELPKGAEREVVPYFTSGTVCSELYTGGDLERLMNSIYCALRPDDRSGLSTQNLLCRQQPLCSSYLEKKNKNPIVELADSLHLQRGEFLLVIYTMFNTMIKAVCS